MMLPDTLLAEGQIVNYVVDLLSQGEVVPIMRRVHSAYSPARAAAIYLARVLRHAPPLPERLVRVARLPMRPENVGLALALTLSDRRDWVLEGWAELPVLFVVHGPHLVVLGGAP